MRRVALPLLGVLLALLPGCTADPFGAPLRVKTHGYRARVTLRSDGADKAAFDLAVLRDLRRKGPEDGPALVLDLAARKAFRLDPAAKTARDVPFAEAVGELPGGIPLAPGFDEKAEAARRNLSVYHREGDEVFAGHVCALWRFDDDPSVPASPTTTYWVAADLDGLVTRYDREAADENGRIRKSTVTLTNVRVGADPGLFSVPSGWTRR
ncbi:MAG TPA: hypothetical protein VLJ18_08885 [Thermoanaerobaculia bacterium]|nr:hypothetical protein [Thermoanaerobaculia bacterium]